MRLAIPMLAQTVGITQQIMASLGSCSQDWTGISTKGTWFRIAIIWLKNPCGVGSYISFHRSAMTSPLVTCGRKKSVRKNTFPCGTSDRRMASKMGERNASTTLRATK